MSEEPPPNSDKKLSTRFFLPHFDWVDDPQESLRARIFIFVCAVFLLAIAAGSLIAFVIEGPSIRRIPAVVSVVLCGACIAISYRMRSIRIAAKIFVFSLSISAMVYIYLTGGLTGYGPPFLLGLPFVAQLFSTTRVSLGIYVAVLLYFGFLVAQVGLQNTNLLLTSIYYVLTLTTLLGISFAYEIMSVRARDLIAKEREKADAANRAKSAFLANTSHEVRTPLNGILGMAQILQQDDLNDEQQERVDIILDSSKTLLGVLDDVLDLSKIEAGRLEITPSPNELATAISNGVKLWYGKAAEKGLALELDIDSDCERVLVFDSTRVRQCLSNLISNAMKFTESGRVSISVHCESADAEKVRVSITVRDTGIGISELDQSKLFEPFTQARRDISIRYGGTGLGLNITKLLTQMMGGDVSVSSKEGFGSAFTMSFTAQLPAEQDSQQEAEDGQSAHSLNTSPMGTNSEWGISILLVDDNAVNRAVIRAFLGKHTSQITEAENGLEAINLLREAQGNFDLVLLDMHMPVMDGPAALKEIRGSAAPWRDIPIIAITADAMTGDKERYMAMGLSGYITKPVDQKEMFATINSTLVKH